MLEERLAADVGALDLPWLSSLRSTTIWVAIPAWSVPTTHSASLPCIRAMAGEDVLQRIVERMADVERAGDVGRRHDDGERRRVGALGAEQALPFPMGIPAGLDRGGVEGLGKFGHEARLNGGAPPINHQPRPPIHCRIQSNTLSYHWIEFLGLSTQWFSSGNTSSFDGMPRRWSAVKLASPCV